MAETEDDGWEFIDHDQFDLYGEGNHLPSSGSEGEGSAVSDVDTDTDGYASDDRMKFELQIPKFNEEDLMTMDKYPAHIKKRENMTLEDVIREHGLPFLPAKSLARFRAVCKNWDKWITNPFLAHKQSTFFLNFSGLFCEFNMLTRSFVSLDPSAYHIPSPSFGFLPEPVIIRNTCNGLLCCQGNAEDKAYYICNPVTQRWQKLPEPKYFHGATGSAVVLAFDPAPLNFDADYDLICAVPMLDCSVLQFEIYSSKTKSWSLCDEVCCEIGSISQAAGGIYMNGIAYWKTEAGQVLAFDYKNGNHDIFPLPPDGDSPGVLTGMGGELCYIQARKTNMGLDVLDVYGVFPLSLRQRIDISSELVGGIKGGFRALPCLSADVLVFLAGKDAYSYNVRDGKVVKLFKSGRGDLQDATFWPYVNSLVHVNSG